MKLNYYNGHLSACMTSENLIFYDFVFEYGANWKLSNLIFFMHQIAFGDGKHERIIVNFEAFEKTLSYTCFLVICWKFIEISCQLTGLV